MLCPKAVAKKDIAFYVAKYDRYQYNLPAVYLTTVTELDKNSKICLKWVQNPAPVDRKPVRMYKLISDDVKKLESLL